MTSTPEEILISLIVDGDTGTDAWEEMERQALEDDGAWRQLAEGFHNANQLRTAVGDVTSVAEGVALPWPRPRLGIGWVEGIVVVLVTAIVTFSFSRDWGTTAPAPELPLSGEWVQDEGPPEPVASPLAEAAASQFVRELPLVLLSSRQLEGEGSLEVTYVRPVVERCVVEDFYEIHRDEQGVPVAVPVGVEKVGQGSSL